MKGSGYQCDWCSKMQIDGHDPFVNPVWWRPHGWVSVIISPARPEIENAPKDFCSMRCAAQWTGSQVDSVEVSG